VASKVVVRCVAQVEPSPHDATVAEAFRAPLDAVQVTGWPSDRMRTEDGRNTS
jgi:hypothetical protein